MFLKVVGNFQKKSTAADTEGIYTLSVSSTVDLVFQYFPGNEQNEVREDLLEANVEDAIEFMFTKGESELAQLTIAIKDLDSQDTWILDSLDGSSLSLVVTTIERAPKNWFETRLEGLTAPRPWYFKAEDIYHLIKYVLDQYHISSSRPVIEAIRAIDFASISVAKHLLSVRIDEGFSIVSKIDDLLESLLSSTDKTVDTKLLQLALSLQHLRKAVTRRLQEISFFTQEKLYQLRTQTNSLAGDYGNIDSAYVWAVEKTGEATNLITTDILGRIRSLRDAGRAVLASVQSQIYNRVSNQVVGYQRSLLVDLPVYAHPYVIGAVEVTQPYLNEAIEKAAPLIQTILDKTPVETWIVGTKDALERNATVGPYVVAATSAATVAIEEVKHYCTDQQYFETPSQEEKSGEISPSVNAN